jgi:hypothetical protein
VAGLSVVVRQQPQKMKMRTRMKMQTKMGVARDYAEDVGH